MKVFIVTEGGIGIGFGHATRCLSLYQAFEKKGMTPELLISGDVTSKELSGFRRHRIFNWLAEKEKLSAIIKGADVVIIDSYLAGLDIYKMLSQLAKKAIYIDDYRRLEYPAGTVINGTIYARTLKWPRRKDVSYMLGTKYLPMRQEFCSAPQKEVRKKVKRLMLTFGGYDYKQMTAKILRLLCDYYPEMVKDVIVGKGFRNRVEINKNMDSNTNLIHNPDASDMKAIMLDTDIAVSTGGQTLYELARLGVPTVGICMADNQEKNLESWQKNGFTEYIGWYDDKNLSSKLVKGINRISDYGERLKRSRVGRNLVDGKGAEKIVKRII